MRADLKSGERWLSNEKDEDGLSSVESEALAGFPEPTVKSSSPNDKAIRQNSVTECSMRALVKCSGLLLVSVFFLKTNELG